MALELIHLIKRNEDGTEALDGSGEVIEGVVFADEDSLLQRQYRDQCLLCGRELIGNGTKIYIPAPIIREVFPSYKGRKGITGGEEGAFVCRSRRKCLNPEQRQLVACLWG